MALLFKRLLKELWLQSDDCTEPIEHIWFSIQEVSKSTGYKREEIKKYANSLIISGKNLNVIVNDILDISRVEAGKLELLSEPISIKEVVENCVASYQIQYQNSPVKISAIFSDKLPKFVLGDSVRMSQILCNLIKNAYKFTQKGQITIKVAVVCT